MHGLTVFVHWLSFFVCKEAYSYILAYVHLPELLLTVQTTSDALCSQVYPPLIHTFSIYLKQGDITVVDRIEVHALVSLNQATDEVPQKEVTLPCNFLSCAM